MNLEEIREKVRKTLALDKSIISDRELTVYINQAIRNYIGCRKSNIIEKIIENLKRYLYPKRRIG